MCVNCVREQKGQSAKLDYPKYVRMIEMNAIASHQSRVPATTT